ncbi:hypothetical protein L1887_27788 [Cichorium endivia]|nr:hypothetical protein L1887_27788 [Cichorium endivia]
MRYGTLLLALLIIASSLLVSNRLSASNFEIYVSCQVYAFVLETLLDASPAADSLFEAFNKIRYGTLLLALLIIASSLPSSLLVSSRLSASISEMYVSCQIYAFVLETLLDASPAADSLFEDFSRSFEFTIGPSL